MDGERNSFVRECRQRGLRDYVFLIKTLPEKRPKRNPRAFFWVSLSGKVITTMAGILFEKLARFFLNARHSRLERPTAKGKISLIQFIREPLVFTKPILRCRSRLVAGKNCLWVREKSTRSFSNS